MQLLFGQLGYEFGQMLSMWQEVGKVVKVGQTPTEPYKDPQRAFKGPF